MKAQDRSARYTVTEVEYDVSSHPEQYSSRYQELEDFGSGTRTVPTGVINNEKWGNVCLHSDHSHSRVGCA